MILLVDDQLTASKPTGKPLWPITSREKRSATPPFRAPATPASTTPVEIKKVLPQSQESRYDNNHYWVK